MPWQKGQSGNPKGGKRTELAGGMTLREMARQHTEVALNALVEIVTESESDPARATAANSLLDRGWGKPTQPISGDGDAQPISMELNMKGLSEATLREIAGST